MIHLGLIRRKGPVTPKRNDPDPAAPTSPKVAGLGEVAGRLRTAIGRLKGNCIKVLPDKQTLLSDAGDLQFFDARATSSGNLTVRQVTPNLAPYNPSGTLQTMLGGANAQILYGPPNGSANIISSTVILGDQFFLDPASGNNSNLAVGQGTVLVHELLHYAVQMGDDLFVSSYNIKYQDQYESSSSAINRWLQNDCNN